MKSCLILEGGAMRGVFSAGILDAFLEHNVSFDACYAVSAGACLACSFLAKQKGRGYAVMTDYLENRDYCSLSSLLRTGDLFGADFLYHKIPEELYPIDNRAFCSNPTRFYAVVTNCNTGVAEYRQVCDQFADVDIVRASASMPLVSRMVALDGEPFLDGGIADPIPLQKALSEGYDRIVVVLTRPRGYRKSPDRLFPAMRLKYRKFPNLLRVMKKRHEIYNESLSFVDRLDRQGEILVLAPESSLRIRRTEKDHAVLSEGYRHGYDLSNSRMEEIKNYLRK